jgi:cytidylate kinase
MSPTRSAASRVSSKGLEQAACGLSTMKTPHARIYLRRFYGISEESLRLYDLVVSTDAVSVEQAAGLVSLDIDL